jgi:hypothetical protein
VPEPVTASLLIVDTAQRLLPSRLIPVCLAVFQSSGASTSDGIGRARAAQWYTSGTRPGEGRAWLRPLSVTARVRSLTPARAANALQRRIAGFRAVCTRKASLVALPPYACARKPVRLLVRARSTASRLCLTLASGSGPLERCAAQAWQRRRREHAHVCQQLRCSPTSTPAENANQRTPVAMANNPSVALPAKDDTRRVEHPLIDPHRFGRKNAHTGECAGTSGVFLV